MNFVNKYGKEICWLSIGFYLCSVVLSYAISEDKDLISVLNSLGGLISAGGAVAAILTIIHVISEKERIAVEGKVNYINYILFILNRKSEFFKIYNVPFETLKPDSIMSIMTIELYEFEYELCNQIDIERAMCLLDTENPELFSKIDELQRNFSSLSRIAKKRHKYYADYQTQVSPILADGQKLNNQRIREIVGNLIINEITSSTKKLGEFGSKLDKDTKSLHANIVYEAHKKYPGFKFILPTT